MSTLRVSGMISGLDTDSIVQALVSAKSEKVETLEKEKILLEWKQEAWQDLNTKIFDFYNSTLSSMRFNSAYEQKESVSSDESVLKITSGTSLIDGVQTAFVESLARTEHLTGGELTTANGGSVTGSTKISELSEDFEGGTFYLNDTSITITDSTTIDEVTSMLSQAGVNASFDEGNGRFNISSKEIGAAGSFTFLDADKNELTMDSDNSLLAALGLNTAGNGTLLEGQDATLVLNGATYTSTTNAFNINGMTFQAMSVSDKELTITTEINYDGFYDAIKNMINEYNALVNEMDALYNADSNSDLSPLTDEEKEAMTESDIELWESKIKEGLLSKDSTMNGITSALYTVMLSGITVGANVDSDGTTMYLSDFGIAGLGYFNAAENERHAFHIDGDSDNSNTSSNTDKLKSMIYTDPDTVKEFFTQLSTNLYTALDERMKSTDFSSVYKVYNDKQMLTEYNAYTTKIEDAEDELNAYEDYWYTKFTAMEVALSQLQSKESAISGLLNM